MLYLEWLPLYWYRALEFKMASIQNVGFLWVFLALALQAEGVLSLPAFVRLSVRPSVRKLYLVRMITRQKYQLESPNVHQTCILGYSRLVLKMEVIDLELQGHFGHFDSELYEIWLVRAITRHRLGLESPNLHQTCILGYSRLLLKMEIIDLDLQGHLAISTHKTAFNVALVHWSRTVKGCYTSQTCSCYSFKLYARSISNEINFMLQGHFYVIFVILNTDKV